MFRNFFLIFLIFSNINTIKSGKLKGRIINGNNAHNGQFPWYAFLTMTQKSESESICGGSIISPRWILTASHCLLSAKKVTIQFGSVYSKKMPFQYESNKFLSNPNYNKHNQNHDIGLVQTPVNIQYSKLIRPVLLPKLSMTDKTLIGSVCSICGFGIYDRKKPSQPSSLKYARVKIFNLSTCGKLIDLTKINTVLCGIEMLKNQNVCVGDSGGGLVLKIKDKSYVIGVVSFGLQGCQDPATMYQSVHTNLNWISSVTNIKIEK